MRERAADRGSWEAKAASNYRMPTPHGLHSSGQPSPLPKRPGPCLSLLACALEDAGHHETRFCLHFRREWAFPSHSCLYEGRRSCLQWYSFGAVS